MEHERSNNILSGFCFSSHRNFGLHIDSAWKSHLPSSSAQHRTVGHPYLIVDFGGADAWRTAVALDEESEDGHRIGDELELGDVLNVILTSDAKALSASKERVYMNVPLESVLAFSALYDAEIAANYALFKMIKQPKGE